VLLDAFNFALVKFFIPLLKFGIGDFFFLHYLFVSLTHHLQISFLLFTCILQIAQCTSELIELFRLVFEFVFFPLVHFVETLDVVSLHFDICCHLFKRNLRPFVPVV